MSSGAPDDAGEGRRIARARRRAQVRRRRAVALLVAALLVGAALGAVVSGSSEGTKGPTATEPGTRSSPDESSTAEATTPAEPTTTAKKPPANSRPVTIEWVGDTVLASSYGTPPNGGRDLLDGVDEVLGGADITFANLEETLSAGGSSKCGAGSPNCYAFQAPPSFAPNLTRAGIDIVNLANNHAFDYLEDGLRQTHRALAGARVKHTGAPRRIVVMRRGGLRIAFVGFASYKWANRIENVPAAARLVRKAASRNDLVVVAFHGGAEGSDKTHVPTGTEWAYGENRGDLRRFSHAVVAAGADLVVGSGPHVVRGLERFRGRLIVYSSGNFAGYRNFSTGGVLSYSGIVRVTLNPDGSFDSGRWFSVLLDGDAVPHLDPAGGAARLVAQLSREDFGGRAPRIAANGVITM